MAIDPDFYSLQTIDPNAEDTVLVDAGDAGIIAVPKSSQKTGTPMVEIAPELPGPMWKVPSVQGFFEGFPGVKKALDTLGSWLNSLGHVLKWVAITVIVILALVLGIKVVGWLRA
jgi:hypothetical protein